MRTLQWGLYGSRHGREFRSGRICLLEMPGVAQGEVISLPWMPSELIEDQASAVDEMVDLVEGLDGVQAVGLGSLLAVVGSRGEALAKRTEVPITSGAAATTWAAMKNTLRVLEVTGESSVAMVGFSGTVGEALGEALGRAGVEVWVGAKGKAVARRAASLGLKHASVEEAVRGRRIVVGAGTTGAVLEPSILEPHSILLDVALPSSLKKGRRPAGLQVLAAEAVALPKGWKRGFWGRLYHLLAGYGPSQIYACLAEPMVMAAQGRTEPFAQGRRLSLEAVDDFGEAAQSMGLEARLARGWKGVNPDRLVR